MRIWWGVSDVKQVICSLTVCGCVCAVCALGCVISCQVREASKQVCVCVCVCQ